MNPKSEIDPRLMKKLSILQAAPDRNPERAADGRAAFLKEAQELTNTVTPVKEMRHNGWMQKIQSIFVIRPKEHSPMFSAFATIMLIVSIALGGGGVTVAAAQSSQPEQLLYGVKLWSEDQYLKLAGDPQNQYQISLELSNRRAEEIQTMVQASGTVPDSVQTRYKNQIDLALQFAMNQPDDQAILALQQIQARLQSQQQVLLRVQTNSSPDAEAALARVQLMIQERLHWVEGGLSDPNQLRDQLRQRDQEQQNSVTPVRQGTQMGPGAGEGGNLWTTVTPAPGSGFGPGECENCTPAGNGQGGNPWTNDTPTPNSGYGPGPGPEPDHTCTPGSGDGSGHQPQPTQQQPGQPTQAGPQPTSSGMGPQPTVMPGGPGSMH